MNRSKATPHRKPTVAIADNDLVLAARWQRKFTHAGFDVVGNLTNKLDTGTNTFTANNLNQLTAIGASAINYDAKGNLTNRPGWLYTWNANNQLVIAEPGSPTNGAVKVTFAYDGKHRCVRRQSWSWSTNTASYSLSASTYLQYSGWNLIEERDGGTNLTAYAYGSQVDEILAKFTSTNTVFYHGDAQNSTLAVTDGSATVLERYRYEAFGLPTIYDSAFNLQPSSAYGNRMLFQGRQWLAEVKLNDHRFRYYSPELQRWLSIDPLGEEGGINLYGFVGNDPADWIDYSGGQGVRPSWRGPPAYNSGNGRPINQPNLPQVRRPGRGPWAPGFPSNNPMFLEIAPPGFFDGGAGAISDALIQDNWDAYRNTVQAILAGNLPVACPPTNRPPTLSQGATEPQFFSGGPPPAYNAGNVNGPPNITIIGYR